MGRVIRPTVILSQNGYWLRDKVIREFLVSLPEGLSQKDVRLEARTKLSSHVGAQKTSRLVRDVLLLHLFRQQNENMFNRALREHEEQFPGS